MPTSLLNFLQEQRESKHRDETVQKIKKERGRREQRTREYLEEAKEEERTGIREGRWRVLGRFLARVLKGEGTGAATQEEFAISLLLFVGSRVRFPNPTEDKPQWKAAAPWPFAFAGKILTKLEISLFYFLFIYFIFSF